MAEIDALDGKAVDGIQAHLAPMDVIVESGDSFKFDDCNSYGPCVTTTGLQRIVPTLLWSKWSWVTVTMSADSSMCLYGSRPVVS